jgi:hypothetical protein
MLRVCAVVAAVATLGVGCGGGRARVGPALPAVTPQGPPAGRVELRVAGAAPGRGGVLAVGDTLRLRPEVADCAVDVCAVRLAPPPAAYAWRSYHPDVASVGADGALVARAVGDATVEVRGEGREAFATFSVIPPAAAIRWEPAELTLQVGDRAVARAVALDSAGRIVALIPLASVGGPEGALARAEPLQRGGWVVVRAEHRGTTYLDAYLGARAARLRVTVRPGDGPRE